MSRRQDYIARVRYQNELPPPPCAPKLLEIPVDVTKLASAGFLSSLVQATKPNVDIDMDLGMPLDATAIAGVIEGDEKAMMATNTSRDPELLDPEDQELLKEPSTGGASRNQPNVLFLRRTEYISSETVKHKTDSPRRRALEASKLSPEDQLQAVEATFEAAQADLSTLRHPTRRGVVAQQSWPVLPDSKMLDLMHLAVKMVGSASLSTLKRKFTTDQQSTALFRRNVVDADEWMTLLMAEDAEEAADLRKRLDLSADTLPSTMDEDKAKYEFRRVTDHDLELVIHASPYDEVAISFAEGEHVAKYVPITGRTNLKRRRVMRQRRDLVDKVSVGTLGLLVREMTAAESVRRDNARHDYDEVNYMAAEAEDDLDEDDDDLDELVQS